MSKSLGNFVTIGEALKKHSADVLRLFFLSAHYRSPLDFTWEHFDEAAHAYERIYDFLSQADQRAASGDGEEGPAAHSASEKFFAALEEDLNTAEALGALHELVGEALGWLGKSGREGEWLKDARRKVRSLGNLLGFSFAQEIPEEVKQLLKEREQVRQKKEFGRSDEIRRAILQKGFVVEDTPTGPVLRQRV